MRLATAVQITQLLTVVIKAAKVTDASRGDVAALAQSCTGLEQFTALGTTWSNKRPSGYFRSQH